jgi:hypothetical protein
MDAFSVASLTLNDDIRHDTRDGDHDDTFPLLDRLLEDLPKVVERFVLSVLDLTALALLSRVGRGGAWSLCPRAFGARESPRGCHLRARSFVSQSSDLRGQKRTAARGTSGRVHVPLRADT